MPENELHGENNNIAVNKFKSLLKQREFGVFLALLVISGVFTIITDSFLSYSNLINTLRQTAELGIMTVGMTMLITSQEFDLSVGSMYALSPIVAGMLVSEVGLNIWSAALLTIALAILLGMLNGVITLKFGIPSFITTLGTQMLFRGGILMLSDGWPVSGLPESNFYSIFGGRFYNFPMQAFWFLIVVVIGYIILHKAKFGYKIFATGGNREAAELSGINTTKVKMICFIFASVTAAFAGFTALSYLGSVSPTQGQGMELEVIAASVIGGTALFGGSGSIIGAFLGAAIMGVVRNGLSIMGTGAYVQQALIGFIIVAAVIINVQYSD
ncbi:MAG: ABC transporter permease [Bacillota bacterium]